MLESTEMISKVGGNKIFSCLRKERWVELFFFSERPAIFDVLGP